MKIAIDAMGGDKAPAEIVKGAIQAVQKFSCEIVLVGVKSKIIEYESLIKNLPIKICHASSSILMEEHPVEALRRKENSSIFLATSLVKDGECDAVISAGSTGAAVASAQLILNRIPNIKRAAIATPIPTLNGTTLLLDSGANVETKPEHLLQFAIMGSVYAKHILKKKNPSIGLLNIGEESTKGNEQTKRAYELLKNCSAINFSGNAEGDEISSGQFDVVICDGFVGNIVLKFAEGFSNTVISLVKQNLIMNDEFKFLKKDNLDEIFKTIVKRFDSSEYGCAPLLGVNGCCLISHGSSDAKAICSAIGTACDYIENRISDKIKNSLHLINGID